MQRNFKDRIHDSAFMIIDYKGYPINRFTTEVYDKDGNTFDKFFTCHEDNIHGAYKKGFEKLKEAMVSDGTIYRLEKYTGSLYEFASRKYFKSPIKRWLYKTYLKMGKLFD